MSTRLIRERLLASTIIATMLAAAPVAAQTTAPTDPTTPAGQDAATAPAGPLEGQNAAPASPQMTGGNGEIVVTGSRIARPNLQSVSPITTVTAQDVKLQGTTSIENLVNTLPQAFVDQSSGVANGANGIATINLRNLGAQRTLVLLDGKRLPPGDPSGGVVTGAAADVNIVPSFLVKRVDVLTGGASATYGADAVAGVVNFILDNSFEGFKFDVQGSINQHTTESRSAFDRITSDPRYNFADNPIFLPRGNTVDGGTFQVGGAFGTNFADGAGHITVYGSYQKQHAVTQDSRDISSCAVASNVYESGGNGGAGTPPRSEDQFCSGSSNTSRLSYLPNGGNGSRRIITLGSGTRAFNGGTDTYNFNPTNYLQRPDSRYTAGFYANYEINDHFKPYLAFNFMDDHTLAQIAPSGTFNNVFTVNCSNPYLSASVGTSLGCATTGAGTLQTVSAALAKRNVEGGGRIDDLRHTDYRISGGLKGDLFEGFSYDAYGQFGTVLYSENYKRDFSRTRVQNAINACRNPDGSTIGDQGCAGYNIFSGTTTIQPNDTLGVTDAALGYVQAPGFKSGQTKEQIISAVIQGDLGTYGIKSPLANDGISIAFGPEYRRESLTLNTDQEFATGDLLGQGGQTRSSSGAYSVTEGFIEVQAPLAQDKPFFQDLSFNGGYRYSHYTTVGHTNTYKLGAEWAPFSGDFENAVRFRGSYNRAVRAPAVQDFFQPAQLGLGGTIDPCAQGAGGRASSTDLATCLLTAQGDPNFAAQYGDGTGIARNPASQYNSITAGAATAGTSLKAETAITKTVGVVLQPSHFLRNFVLSVDYYNINLKNQIGTDGYNTIITQCLATGSAYYCGLIHRDPTNGSLWLGPNGFINDPIYNAGHLKTSGIDVSSSYNYDAGRFGRISLAFNGSYLLKNKQEVTIHNDDGSVSSGGFYDCRSFYGDFCGVPNPKWRHTARLTLSPIEAFSFSAQWRFIGHTNLDAANQDTDSAGNFLIGGVPKGDLKNNRIPNVSYFDLAATFNASERFQFRAGVNNALDKNAPVIAGGDLGAGNNNGNTYPGYYDVLGRYFFIGASMNF